MGIQKENLKRIYCRDAQYLLRTCTCLDFLLCPILLTQPSHTIKLRVRNINRCLTPFSTFVDNERKPLEKYIALMNESLFIIFFKIIFSLCLVCLFTMSYAFVD